MPIKLTIKEKEIIVLFLKNNNNSLFSNKIYDLLIKEKKKITKRTVKNILEKYNQFNKSNNISLFIKELDNNTGGTCYRINEDIETFIELSRNLLKNTFSNLFFQSKYAQQFIKNKNIMKYIEKNLKIEYTQEARFGIHQIVKNSPTALYFGLFAKNTLSQKLDSEDKDTTKESERLVLENFIFGLFNDLKEQNYYIEKNVKNLIVKLNLHWEIKNKKPIEINIELPY